jgi:simple sugar transport system permease protein
MDAIGATTFILRQAVLSATPLLLAGFGELVAERAGVINIGIEGLMLMGAVAGYAAAVASGSALWAIPAAAVVGVIFAAAFAAITIWCRADQIVTGTALNILAFGASTTAWRVLQDYMQRHAGAASVALFEPVRVPGLRKVPVLGEVLFNQYGLFYAVVVLAIFLGLVLRRTRVGLIVQGLGDAPAACDAAGIRVRWWRTGLVLFAGACAGVAGAYLSTMRGHSFQVNMTGGQGFLVLALVIFGRWRLSGFVAGTLMFGALDGLQSYLAAFPGATRAVPHQLFDMLPYAATLVALALLTRSRAGPLALGVPWPAEK